MAEEKRVELNAATEDPQYLYELTQKYMLDYVKIRGTKEDKKWYHDLVFANKKKVKRGDKEFEVLDVKAVRKDFATRFFSDLGKKKKKKGTYFDEVEALVKDL